MRNNKKTNNADISERHTTHYIHQDQEQNHVEKQQEDKEQEKELDQNQEQMQRVRKKTNKQGHQLDKVQKSAKLDKDNAYKDGPGHIYIFQEREFITLNQPIYKIGKTRDVIQRYGQYPKGTKVMFCVEVDKVLESEGKLITMLREKFINRKDIGREYFEANKEAFLKCVMGYMYQ